LNKNDENTKTMIDLGLTRSQALSYLTLIELGSASVKEVARLSNIARPDTYRALADLQELGLVEKIVMFPTKFKPLSIVDAVNVLMLSRNKETETLNKRANALIGLLSEKNLKTKQSENNQLTIILGGDAITAKLHKILQNSKEQVCVLCSRKNFFQCKQFISEAIQETLKGKVEFLLLTENSAGPREEKEIRDLRKSPAAQIKYVHFPPSVCFAVFDRRELVLTTTPKLEYSEFSAIWSNNPSLVELAQSYFEHVWNQI